MWAGQGSSVEGWASEVELDGDNGGEVGEAHQDADADDEGNRRSD